MKNQIPKEDWKKSGIYCIENIINGKKYIGSTSYFNRRLNKHLFELRANKHPNKHLQNSYNINGCDSFCFYILEVTNNLIERENYYISKFNTNNKLHGYNRRVSAESCKGIKHSIHSGTRVKGKKLSKETCLKMSVSRSGEKHHQAIVNDEIVRWIKIMLFHGYRNINIANHFGVKKSIINDIKNGGGWDHILLTEKDYQSKISCVSTSRLNYDQVLVAKYLLKNGIDNHQIAKYLGVKNVIKEIKSGKTYKDVILEVDKENELKKTIDLDNIRSIKIDRSQKLNKMQS